MFFINRSCGCRGFQRCNQCHRSVGGPKIYINESICTGKSKSVFKLKHSEKGKHYFEHHGKHHCRSDDCEKDKCKCDDCEKHKCKCVDCEKHKCKCEDCGKNKCKCEDCWKDKCKCVDCEKHKCKCEDCGKDKCKCVDCEKHKCKWDGCEEFNGDSNIFEMMLGESDDIPKDNCNDDHKLCPEEIKGFDFCRKEEELRCFKHCGPISQPCDCNYYNHFTSRSNLDFSGLIVIKNTGNSASGCSMEVRVTDIAGSAIVATVSPGASVPIFVECLRSLDIACFKNESVTETCSGEVIFDLEYCTTRYVSHRYK